MSALARWREIEKMLDACAPGWSWEQKLHFRAVTANGRLYSTLPKHDEIEVGHVRKMCRHLQIYDCAKEHIKSLSQ